MKYNIKGVMIFMLVVMFELNQTLNVSDTGSISTRYSVIWFHRGHTLTQPFILSIMSQVGVKSGLQISFCPDPRLHVYLTTFLRRNLSSPDKRQD